MYIYIIKISRLNNTQNENIKLRFKTKIKFNWTIYYMYRYLIQTIVKHFVYSTTSLSSNFLVKIIIIINYKLIMIRFL